MKFFKYVLISLVIFSACNLSDENEHDSDNNDIATPKNTVKIQLSLNSANEKVTIGDTVKFNVQIIGEINTVDSFVVMLSGKKVAGADSLPVLVSVPSISSKVGRQRALVKVFSGAKIYSGSYPLELFSDIEPTVKTYKVKKVYKHDDKAYTQGLLIHDGEMYEGTGGKGASSLRKIDLETGKILESIALARNYFGEGITIYEDKIIQLTWQNRIAFVYDIKTFKKVSEFRYPYEGWGITTIGDKLYISDGTSNIYILDAKTFSEIDRLQVYDSRGPVTNINELEYIDGKIYANLYTSNQIAVIDIETGKLISIIDLTGLLPVKDHDFNTDVLNGIAYNNEQKRLFVTGKNWPKLFEIELVD